MQSSARKLDRMASAMFQISICRQVKKRNDLRPGDINECVELAIHEVNPFAEEKGLSISVDLEACGGDLYFDQGEIVQVLINVLDNACKFTRRAGSIKIRGYPYFWERRKINTTLEPQMERRRHHSRGFNAYRLDIVDSGQVIPEEHLDGIFEEYTSYSGGRDRSGGGLGLAVCKMIVTQHEGYVWAENTELGPMFSFVLPMQCSF
jgi:two-component system phosphate regulon sensor histidine kinase PhoR